MRKSRSKSFAKKSRFASPRIVLLSLAALTVLVGVALTATATNPVINAHQSTIGSTDSTTDATPSCTQPDGELMPLAAKAVKSRDEAKALVAQGSGSNSQFVYDPFGRVAKIVDPTGNVRQFVWSGATLCEERNSAGVVTKQFFPWGEIIAGTSYYYTRDHLGSVTEMTNSAGTVIAEYRYDAFGNVTKIQGNTVDSDFLYAGYFYHQPSGLYITLHRLYSPKLARWLNRDPIDDPNLTMMAKVPDPYEPNVASSRPVSFKSSTEFSNPRLPGIQPVPSPSRVFRGGNVYAYAANNPVLYRDPSGLEASIPGPAPVCPNNDLYNQCVRNCERENAGDAQAIANCIWYVCRRYLGLSG